MNQCIIKRIIFYHPIQNLLVQCRFTEFIQFFVYTLACQIFEHDCIGLLKTMEFLDCYTCVLVLEGKSKWFWLVGVFYVTCASGFELTHTLNTLYNHIHVQYCSTLLCTNKISVLDTSKQISSQISHIKCNNIWHLHELLWKKNTIFAHPEYALQNQLTIKTNTFSKNLYFALFNYIMSKWWKCSINTGWSRRVKIFLHEFCFVTPCIIFVSPWIWDQNVHNEYLHFITFLLIYSLIGLW